MENFLFPDDMLYALAAKPAGTAELTPVELHGGYLIKRDDLFEVAGVRGGKARTCWALSQGARGLVTAGWFGSPQVQIVAHIAKHLGIPARGYVPGNKTMNGCAMADDSTVPEAQALGMEMVRAESWALGYRSVITQKAKRYAQASGWREIPFGMECDEAINQTRQQVANLPDCARLIVPVGSGMSLAGILWGIRDFGKRMPVLGVIVGACPTKRLNRYAPPDWQEMATLVTTGGKSSTGRAPAAYGKAATTVTLGTLLLDAHYEAKCLPYLQAGDALWVVGIRKNSDL